MISGFMIVKDVLSQGYPFVEAIASVLSICDELLVSDGHSADGTYEVLEKIANVNSKVKIYRTNWQGKKDITTLTDATNEVRSKCKYEYIFSVQANEIIHEQSAPIIKSLPNMFTDVDNFSFSYLQLLNKYKLTEEFRLRFSKNLPGIVAVCDAWRLGTTKAFDRSKKFTCINPKRLSGYISNGIWYTFANPCTGPHSRAVYLPNPVFRYWALFPKDFLEKFRKHSELFHLDGFEEPLDKLEAHIDNPETFWKLGADALSRTRFKDRPNYPSDYNAVDKANHPAIMQNFISNPKITQYYVREELFQQIKKL